MDVRDAEMVALLLARDGPPSPTPPHSAYGACRYSELYGGKPCPWCEAEGRRNAGQIRLMGPNTRWLP